MGNQLAGIAPSQIYPVEHYIADVSEFSYDANLGSTRFFKVARAKHKEGFTVVKVFAIHDPSLPLKSHKDRIEGMRSLLTGVPNCLPFQKAILTDKAALLVRQYVKDNLYDRISTRPFLNSIEKRWIAFQLISAVYECHKLGVCHGDIKLENIMITGWNWVLLTDFASFKPTYLPEDNPADFSYFFDTSRRRTCYIAPERFVKSINSETLPTSANTLILGEVKRGDLMPYMDIFSLGCALTELFTEGHAPFDFSELLTYRIGEYSPWKVLEKIDDLYIRELVHHMMQLEPSNRLSAGEYLEQQRGKAFPKYFYSFLHEYMQSFASTVVMSPDEKITKLKKDIKHILKVFVCDGSDSPEYGKEGSLREGLVIIVSVVTSCLRALKHSCAKLDALQLLKEMVPYLSSEIILDRLLPYMLFLMNDIYPRVRAAAVHTLTHCLLLVKMIPRSDANIFPEYILPNLSHVPQDPAVIVRVAFAENIAVLAETALRFLEMSQLESGTGDSITDMTENETQHHQASYDTELQALHELIQQSVSTLLSDSDNIVKQTLLEHGITRLCVFFGRQKANDVLLSHMITFLNDKEDRHLRGSFFDSIVGVGAYVGWQCSPILKPLLQQGLADPEEFVISKTLHAMTDLAELGLLQKQMLYELVSETAPLLCHPNLWIRQGTVGFICAVAKTLSLADVQCKLLPVVQPFLKQPVIQVQKEAIVLNALHDPLPRGLLDYLVRLPVLPTLLESLRERQLLRSIVRVGHQPAYAEMDLALKPVYRRLQSEGMTEAIEDKILKMKDHLLKMNKTKGSMSADPRAGASNEQDGIIDLSALRIPRYHEDLVRPSTIGENQFSQSQRRAAKKKVGSLDSPTITMNEEWQHMFGAGRRSPSSPKLPPHGIDAQGSSPQGITTPTKNSATPPLVGGTFQKQSSVSSSEGTVRRQNSALSQDRNSTDYQCVPCQHELQALIYKKRNEYARDEVLRQVSENIGKDSHSPPPKWRPKGTLVAHLHEHQGAVNRLQVIPNTTLFATCSSDGTLKVWDCGRMEGRSIANRSRKTYKLEGQAITLTVCQNLQSLAVASDSGSIHVVRIEYSSPKMNVLQTRSLDPQEDGCVVDMNYFDTGSQSILAYASVYGSIVGWDLRSPGTAWKLDNDPRKGLITTFIVDPHQCWLAAGTSKGHIICWDMRFQLPITTVVHPAEARVRRLLLHQTSPSRVLASVQWNNEISVWDMETAARIQTLWASSYPALSVTETTNNAVYSMYMGQGESGPFVLTGGSDRRIRYWDLANPIKSYMVVGAANDPIAANSFVYKSRLIDGTEVILETHANVAEGFSESVAHARVPAGEEHSKYYPEEPPVGHHDCISDLGVLQASQCYILSASQDGVVKIWK